MPVPRRNRRSLQSGGLADATVGISEHSCGDCAAFSTCWRAVRACVGAGAIRKTRGRARRWISGGSRSTSVPYKLRLRAEMKVPGRAWLQFEVEPLPTGSRIRQTAEFDPRGLFGLLYWYGIYPLHTMVFAGMLREIAKAAVSEPREESVS
ncbi:MAG: DUF2867 domain-containing protein [Bryobacterales bacterium]